MWRCGEYYDIEHVIYISYSKQHVAVPNDTHAHASERHASEQKTWQKWENIADVGERRVPVVVPREHQLYFIKVEAINTVPVTAVATLAAVSPICGYMAIATMCVHVRRQQRAAIAKRL